MIIINNSESLTDKVVFFLCGDMTEQYSCHHTIRAQGVLKFLIPQEYASISVNKLEKTEELASDKTSEEASISVDKLEKTEELASDKTSKEASISVDKLEKMEDLSPYKMLNNITVYTVPVNTRIMCTDTGQFSIGWLDPKDALKPMSAIALVPNQ